MDKVDHTGRRVMLTLQDCYLLNNEEWKRKMTEPNEEVVDMDELTQLEDSTTVMESTVEDKPSDEPESEEVVEDVEDEEDDDVDDDDDDEDDNFESDTDGSPGNSSEGDTATEVGENK